MSFAGKRSNVDCLAGALAMNGWPDECDVLGAETSNEGQFHYHQGVLVAIGLVFTWTWRRLVGKTEAGF